QFTLDFRALRGGGQSDLVGKSLDHALAVNPEPPGGCPDWCDCPPDLGNTIPRIFPSLFFREGSSKLGEEALVKCQGVRIQPRIELSDRPLLTQEARGLRIRRSELPDQ